MSQIPSNIGFTEPQTNSTSSAIQDVDLDQFLELMIAELQNQDPLDPLDNSEMLQQITAIREIGSNDRLSETLAAVHTGQNLSTASSMIGKTVDAISDDGANVRGVVDRVSVEVDEDTSQRTLRVHVDGDSVRLENIRQITS